MTRGWAFGCLVLALTCAGCGSTEGVIDTNTALATFRQAGFRNLIVLSNRRAYVQLAREAHDPSRVRKALDEDTILTRSVRNPLLAPLFAVRFARVEDAKQRFANDHALLGGKLPQQEQAILPHGYSLSRLQDVRVCNLVVASYNANNEQALQARFARAIALLKKKC